MTTTDDTATLPLRSVVCFRNSVAQFTHAQPAAAAAQRLALTLDAPSAALARATLSVDATVLLDRAKADAHRAARHAATVRRRAFDALSSQCVIF